MTVKYADLHIHTNYSDSTFSPEEVIVAARDSGLSAVSITDHDTVNGIPDSIKYGEQYGIEVIPGIEMTVEKDEREVHILGYYIDWKSDTLLKKIKAIQESRVKRIYQMVELLKQEGIDIDPEEVINYAGRGTLGRLHLASVMQKKEKIATIKEAFNKYIGFSKSCYVPHMKFSPEEAIKLILASGGVPVLAHPAVTNNAPFIPEFTAIGLRGLEIYHSDHNKADQKRFLKIAEKHGLIATGGSDCHGMGKGRMLIGTVMMEYTVVEKLKEERDRIRNAEKS